MVFDTLPWQSLSTNNNHNNPHPPVLSSLGCGKSRAGFFYFFLFFCTELESIWSSRLRRMCQGRRVLVPGEAPWGGAVAEPHRVQQENNDGCVDFPLSEPKLNTLGVTWECISLSALISALHPRSVTFSRLLGEHPTTHQSSVCTPGAGAGRDQARSRERCTPALGRSGGSWGALERRAEPLSRQVPAGCAFPGIQFPD